MSNATVTIPLDEYKAFEDHIASVNKRSADLLKELDAARLVDPSGRVEQLTKLARALFTTLSFATANLHPRDIKRWPTIALRDIADLIQSLPDRTAHDDENADWLRSFATECEMWEERRRANGEKEIPPPFPIEDHPITQLIQGRTPSQDSNPGAELKTNPATP